MRGTFANVRIRNQIASKQGGYTTYFPENTEMTIFEAAEKYREQNTPLIVLAGEGFGPVPGQVLVHLAGLELEGEILGWYDLGVRLNLPNVPLAAATDAEVIVIRGDGAAANPLKITVLPPQPAGPALNPPQPK